ncbi:hypothetical protein BY996DRAFT_6477054 [Phakopsora pachyrhizi]|nr:hypothetical protein BY996DRAFT_6502581 [Phakopsora pachyrhizi]KAI8451510.1 hypothetical protein BY996DRAFT_6477054 [Phakopsora pachyrhizi]
MDDFKNNRDSKLKEIKSDISKKKSDINKSSTFKILQRELQGIEMEIAANREAEETDQAVELAREEHKGLKEKLKQAKLKEMEKTKPAKLKSTGELDSGILSLKHKIESLGQERKAARCGGRNGKGRMGKGGAGSAPEVLRVGFWWILQDFEEEGVTVEGNRWHHWKKGQKLGGGAHQGQSAGAKLQELRTCKGFL